MTTAEDELLRPGDAVELLGVTHTLADWADTGVISSLVAPGGHRRYPPPTSATLITRQDTLKASPESGAPRHPRGSTSGHTNGSHARRGRPLTEAEVDLLADAPSVQD